MQFGRTAQAGDGDCGETVKRGSEAVLAALGSLSFGDLGATAKRLALTVGESMGGTSGALYQIFFAAAAVTLNGVAAEAAGPEDWASALQAGVEAVRRYGLAAVGDRTMVDALEPAMHAVNAAVEAGAIAAQPVKACACETRRSCYLCCAGAGAGSPVLELSWQALSAARSEHAECAVNCVALGVTIAWCGLWAAARCTGVSLVNGTCDCRGSKRRGSVQHWVVACAGDKSAAAVAAAGCEAAQKGADATRDMAGRGGRAGYVNPDLLKGVPDPGASAVAAWMGAITHGLQ